MTGLKPDYEKPLPNPEICRTRYLGHVINLCECLVNNPNRCPYVLRFGEGVFCRHPDGRKFEKPGNS